MKTVIVIGSDEFGKEHVRALLQAFRDCELANFPDKQISIRVYVPELTNDVVKEILTSIKPPFRYGPMVFKVKEV